MCIEVVRKKWKAYTNMHDINCVSRRFHGRDPVAITTDHQPKPRVQWVPLAACFQLVTLHIHSCAAVITKFLRDMPAIPILKASATHLLVRRCCC